MADPITMNTTQKSVRHIDGFLADDGVTPATVEASPSGQMITWESDNPAILTTVASPDGMDVEAVTVDNSMAPGSPAVTITVTGRADANKDPAVRDEITDVQV